MLTAAYNCRGIRNSQNMKNYGNNNGPISYNLEAIIDIKYNIKNIIYIIGIKYIFFY